MADNDVRIKLSLDGDKQVAQGLAGVGDGADKANSKLGGLVSGGLKGAGVAVAGLAVAGVAAGGVLSGAVISSYADFEQNLGGIETMFKGSSDKMVAYADEAYITAGLSANEYMSQVTGFSASLLQGLGGDTEAASEVANTAMIDMSDNANKFGSNIADIQNAYQGFAKQNYTMLDNLKLGYGGTASEMARLINDSGVMGDAFTATAENMDEVPFDKVIEGIHAIQEDMGVAGTTSKEASETISGSIGMLKGSFDNLLTGLGSADADVASLAGNVITSLETVITNVGPVIENIGANMTTLGPKMGEMLSGLVGVVSEALPGLVTAGISMIGGLIEGIITALPALVETMVPAILGLVEMITTQLPLLLDAGMKAIIALGQGLVEALPTMIPMIVEMVTGIANTIVENLPLFLEVALELIMALATGLLEALPTLIEALPEIITGLVDFLINATPMIIEAGIELLMALVEAIPEIIPALIEAIPQIIEGIINAIIGSSEQISASGQQLFMKLVDRMGAISTDIAAKMLPIIQGILGAISGFAGDMIKAGGDLLQGLWSGINGMAGWLWDKVKGWAGGLLQNVKDFFGIKSPSREMAKIGKELPRGLSVGINSTANEVKKTADNLAKAVKQAFAEGLITKQAASAMLKDIRKNKNDLVKVIAKNEKLDKAIDEEKKRYKSLTKARRDYIDGIRDSVTSSSNVTGFDINGYSSVGLITGGLKKQIGDIKAFRKQLDTLTKKGLDSKTRDDLMSEFLANGSSQTADMLSKESASSIKEIGKLRKQLDAQAKGLGTTVGDQMYEAGINTSKGLIKGLESQQDKLEKIGDRMGRTLIRSVKKALKIKSPSRVFEDEIGAMIPEGAGIGIARNEDKALAPLRSMGDSLIEESKRIPGLVAGNVAGAGEALAFENTPNPTQLTPSMMVVNPVVNIDASTLSAAFENWLASGGGQTTVEVKTDVHVADQDPRIMGAQLGRAVKGVLVG